MRFSEPLVSGRLIRRYKRFLCDVELESEEVVVAHCCNPGSMLGLTAPGSVVWLSPVADTARTLRFAWELVEVDGHFVGINTARPNALVAEAVRAGRVPELGAYEGLRREVRYGTNSRIDLRLEAADCPPCYVEVKNVHLKRQERIAEFPDSVTVRGAKHLAELAVMAGTGARAVMFLLVQRGDCDGMAIAADIDPVYEQAFQSALECGVETVCYCCNVTLEGIELNHRLPLIR
jgi:sugar fermentation stimulation protein A